MRPCLGLLRLRRDDVMHGSANPVVDWTGVDIELLAHILVRIGLHVGKQIQQQFQRASNQLLWDRRAESVAPPPTEEMKLQRLGGVFGILGGYRLNGAT